MSQILSVGHSLLTSGLDYPVHLTTISNGVHLHHKLKCMKQNMQSQTQHVNNVK